MFEFKNISITTSMITMLLCLVLMLAPELIAFIFAIDASESAFFIGRRAAMLFLGLSVMSWMGRNAVHSESRQATCLGLTIAMFGLAILGVTEFMRGYTGPGIFLAVATEIVIASLFLKVWLTNRGA